MVFGQTRKIIKSRFNELTILESFIHILEELRVRFSNELKAERNQLSKTLFVNFNDKNLNIKIIRFLEIIEDEGDLIFKYRNKLINILTTIKNEDIINIKNISLRKRSLDHYDNELKILLKRGIKKDLLMEKIGIQEDTILSTFCYLIHFCVIDPHNEEHIYSIYRFISVRIKRLPPIRLGPEFEKTTNKIITSNPFNDIILGNKSLFDFVSLDDKSDDYVIKSINKLITAVNRKKIIKLSYKSSDNEISIFNLADYDNDIRRSIITGIHKTKEELIKMKKEFIDYLKNKH